MNAKEFELSRVITVEVLRAAGRCTGGGFFFGPKAPALTDKITFWEEILALKAFRAVLFFS